MFAFLLSCSQLPTVKELPKKAISFQTFKQNVNGFCLNAEGRAQISVGEKSFTVSYDTQTPHQNKFILTAYIPFQGGEELIVERISGNRYKFSGGFVGMIKSRFYAYADSNSELKREDLNIFLSSIAKEIFQAIDFKKKNDTKLKSYFDQWCGKALGVKCTSTSGNRVFSIESPSTSVRKTERNLEFIWKNTDMNYQGKAYYRQSFFELLNQGNPILSARLFAEQCQ